MSSSHMLLNKLFVSLDNVLELDADQLKALGMEDPLALRPRNNVGKSIGEAAFMLDYDGLLVPSARWDCCKLVVFLDNTPFDISERLSFVQAIDVNWPAWRERTRCD